MQSETRVTVSALRQMLTERPLRVGALAAVAIVLALLGSPQIYSAVETYAVGEFTTRAIRAPYDFSLVDEAATDAQRERAAASVAVVTRFDPAVAAAVRARLAGALEPLVGAAAALETANAPPAEPAPRTRTARLALEAERQRARDAAASSLDEAWDAAASTLGAPAPEEVRRALREAGSSASLTDTAARLVDDVYAAPLVADRGALDQLMAAPDGAPERSRQVVLVRADDSRERVLAADALRELSEARSRIAERAPTIGAGFHPLVRTWLAEAVANSLRPDAAFDAAATESRRRDAAEAVLPVSINFARNQLIVGEGEPVTRQVVLVLDYLRRQRFATGALSRVLGRMGVMFALLLLAFWTEERGRTRFAIDFAHFTYALSALVVTIVLFRGWLWLAEDLHVRFPAVPVLAFVLAFPAGAPTMYTRVVAGFQSTLGFAFILAIFAGLMWRIDLLLTIYVFIIGLIGSHFAVRCNRRQCVAQAGLLTGLLVAPVAACLALLDSQALDAAAWVVAGGVTGAVLSGLVMLAVSPVLESIFGHMTRIRLVELMNYQHPLLRRLTEATPGTFQHSVTVGILSDAAARAIDADPLLVRVASLYHDVGKLAQPEYFIENQHGANPHDAIGPAESARIIIDHVPEGVRLVREAGVGERIADFVREHHGTSLVRYFYIRAHEQDPSTDVRAFQYPGPRPRSRETAILMVADQVEATARVMPEPTEAAFREMVQRTIDRAREEGQFEESPLTFQDLASIREALVRALAGVHHRRLTYPDAAPARAT